MYRNKNCDSFCYDCNAEWCDRRVQPTENYVIALNREYETGSFIFCGFNFNTFTGAFKAFGTPQYLRLNDLKNEELIRSLNYLIDKDYEALEDYTCNERQLEWALQELEARNREAA